MGLAAGHRALVGRGKRDCPGRELGVRDREVGCLGLGSILRDVCVGCGVQLLAVVVKPRRRRLSQKDLRAMGAAGGVRLFRMYYALPTASTL
jgi:hypothetical protein